MRSSITKQILPFILIVGFTACNERQPEVHHTTSENVSNTTSAPIVEDEVVYVETQKDTYIRTPIPILNDDVINTETETFVKSEPPASSMKKTSTQNQIFTGGTITDGLDMAHIRMSESAAKTRLVFDSYMKTSKAKYSGHYTFNYDANKHHITAIVSGYRNFSALPSSKKRLFTTSKMVKAIYLEKYLDDSGYKFSIQLRQNAQVNVFELKEPGRIIVDISPL